MTPKVRTAAQLEAMDSSEVDAIFENSIIWDPADTHQDLLARTRERIVRRIEETEPTPRSRLIAVRSGRRTGSSRTSTASWIRSGDRTVTIDYGFPDDRAAAHCRTIR